ncbi:MAG: hypothetical protein A3F10_06420 [Coxiella sp. RIFCSPHIGHO2_12_FULL_42_15]|nr:MAG: hypothetical protein A3F10_06420 [Coxiella sp. RIFCSPHIGHO2_12_FULL_42_15]
MDQVTAPTLHETLTAGQRLTSFAHDLGRTLANRHFKHSDFYLTEKPPTTLCRLNVWRIFVEPYREEATAKVAAQRYLEKLLTQQQTLLHGNLTTEHILISENHLKISTAEAPFYGPMGFDLGQLVGDLLLLYACNHTFEFQQWLLQQITTLWRTYRDTFMILWNHEACGTLFNTTLFTASETQSYQKQYLLSVLRDMVGFAAILIAPLSEEKIARRLLLASFDLNSIFQFTELIQQHTRILDESSRQTLPYYLGCNE